MWATHGVQAQPLAIRACPQTATDRCSCCHTGVLSKPVPRFHHILDWDSDVPARTVLAIFYYHSHAMGILVVLWVLLPSANILILFLVPNTNSAASKPFTELITSFCLLCGGLVFMESTDQSIEAMEYRGFTPMFTFNLSVGFVSLLMAWEMILFIWKDWLIKTRKTSL